MLLQESKHASINKAYPQTEVHAKLIVLAYNINQKPHFDGDQSIQHVQTRRSLTDRQTADKRRPSKLPYNLPATEEVGKSRRGQPFGKEMWQIQKAALASKFKDDGWSPRKRLSPDALEGIRVLHSQYPEKFTTPVLADQFKVSPEAIRRILKSKWKANEEDQASRQERWERRGLGIWSRLAEEGMKPPKKWRQKGAGKGAWFAKSVSRGIKKPDLESQTALLGSVSFNTRPSISEKFL
ncbi:MAG: hypothetical protein Q9190_001376 [Brigantiaea leucoxantha]